jgi:hypothetical protein
MANADNDFQQNFLSLANLSPATFTAMAQKGSSLWLSLVAPSFTTVALLLSDVSLFCPFSANGSPEEFSDIARWKIVQRRRDLEDIRTGRRTPEQVERGQLVANHTHRGMRVSQHGRGM